MIDPAAAHLVAAAAVITAAVHDTDDPDRVLEVATDLAGLTDTFATWLTARTEATVFVGTLHAVDVVRTTDREGRALPGKAELTFDERDRSGTRETITSDWLTDRFARRVLDRARTLTGTRVLVWKHNQPDPTGEASHGYRRVIDIAPAPRPTTAGDPPEYTGQPHTSVLDDDAYREVLAIRVRRLMETDRVNARNELLTRGVSLAKPGSTRAALEDFGRWLDAHHPLGVDR